MSAKRLATFLLVLCTICVLPSVAEAGNVTRKDARDSRSALDIASVSHSYVNGPFVTHRLRTYRPFSSQLLKGDNAVAFGFDTNNDSSPDLLGVAAWAQGRLRAALIDRRGNLVLQPRVSRPDARTVAIAIPEGYVGGRERGTYRWAGLTLYKAKKGCAKTCTDIAPNRGFIFHRLWELSTLSVTVAGTGRVAAPGVGLDCSAGTCTARYRKGRTVSLTATPAEGWVFGGWSGACTGIAACEVSVGSATSVTATFLPLHTLSVSMTRPGYVVVVPPEREIHCSTAAPCSYRYAAGTTVTLRVVTGPAFVFLGWAGACSGTDPVCTVTMDGTKSVIATTAIPSILSVTFDDSSGGSGRVTSVPAGIDCPGDCSEQYAPPVPVTLTAVADAGSMFSGWTSITCAGAGPVCTVFWPDDPATRFATAAFAPAG
jgi:Divergent InlB B-repeat domain